MIIYCTKKTIERYKLKMPHELSNIFLRETAKKVIELESGDGLVEWGIKLFFLDGRKCLQVMNFASRLSVVLPDFKMDALPYLGNAIAERLLELFSNKTDMKPLLERLFEEHFAAVFSNLTDRGVISQLNRNQLDFFDDGWWRQFIRDGVFHSKELNRFLNYEHIVRRPGTKGWSANSHSYTGPEFERLLRERYGK